MSIREWLSDPAAHISYAPILTPGRVALHSVTEGVIGVALLSIAAALVAFFTLRQRLRYRWLGYLFAPLLVASGLSHFVAIYTQGSPAYGAEILIELAAAVLSVGTAGVLWRMIPTVVAAPSAAQLTGLNAQLTATAAEQTAALKNANQRLTRALEETTLAQQSLVRSEEQYRVSFEGAMVGKVQSDPASGRILRTNPAFAAMLGYEPDELVGRVGWELTWPDDRAGDQAAFARVRSGEIGAYVREKRFLRKDGAPLWGRVSANVVRFPEGGQPDITIAVVENIDERRKTNAVLDATRLLLEGVVVEREAALVQRDLLLREVYHRVKNNLQMVDSMLVLQGRRLANPAAKSALASLRGRVHALGLVHQQLMGSADLQTFDIAPFLRELTHNIVEGAAATGVGLSVEAPPLDVGLDFAIPLGLLVTELVTNSIKHAFPSGTGNVQVMLSRSEDGAISLVVSDDGAGYDCSRFEAQELSGRLGTTIIDGLVRQLHGTMTVQSLNGARTEVRMARAA